MQRVYKFGGQPLLLDWMNANPAVRNAFDSTFGERAGKGWMHATAGSLVGVGEIALLPLDVRRVFSRPPSECSWGEYT